MLQLKKLRALSSGKMYNYFKINHKLKIKSVCFLMWFSSFFTFWFNQRITYYAFFDANNKILWEMKWKQQNCLKYNKVIKMLFAILPLLLWIRQLAGGLWLLKYSRKNLFVLSCNLFFLFFFKKIFTLLVTNNFDAHKID